MKIEKNPKLLRKTFYLPKNIEGSESLLLKSKAGVSYDIPLNILEKIYEYMIEIKYKLKKGEAIETAITPNPTIKNFCEKHFKELYLSKNPKDGWQLEKVVDYFYDKRIKDITANDIEHFKVDMKNQGYASSTIRKYCLILRLVLKTAISIDYIMKNPAESVKLPSNKPEKERENIESELLPELFYKMKQVNWHLYIYCKFAYLTGLRSSDIINLKYSDITIINGIKCISLRESKNKDKATRGRTIIPLHPALIEMLKPGGKDYVIEYPYSRSNMIYRMCRLFKKICPDYTPYHFRHTFATELSKANVIETHINFLLGKLPEGSIKNYLKRDIGTLYEAIKKLKFEEFEPEENNLALVG
ncbi:tyrosine-type recombinase/integrase [Candidatus Dependentiae bacterium]|nr:tyrosine-type recombinase/integrase [Candidatus Dependentiae bacterium]